MGGRGPRGESRSGGTSADPLNAAIEFLEAAASEWMTPDQKSALEKLTGELSQLAGMSDYTMTELFQRHPKPFSKAMLLFFQLDKCVDLVELQHPELSEVDVASAAILFSARDGWLGLPVSLKGAGALQEAISHRMAALEHRFGITGIALGDPPRPPATLRELFSPGTRGWSGRQKEAALTLARKNGWDVITTRIDLGKGDYALSIDGRGAHLTLPGDVKAVVFEVDEKRFLAFIAKTHIKAAHEKEARKLMGAKL